MKKKCNCDICGDVDFSDDNGYKYVLDELKNTRDNIDNIIKVIESRIEKDAIIDEVLNTDYPDDEYNIDMRTPSDEATIKAIEKALSDYDALKRRQRTRRTYPWWSIYPTNTTVWY